VDHPARGRQGGADGAATTISRSDGSKMKGKGKQFVPHGQRVFLAFPGGAGFGDASQRDPARVRLDVARGYISAEAAARDYGMSTADVADVLEKVKNGVAV
jgi:N-methylhydantoinase B